MFRYFHCHHPAFLCLLFSTVALAAPPAVDTPLTKENLFRRDGEVLIGAEQGTVIINGVRVLKENAHIVADTVVFNGTLVTENFDLSIVARTVIFAQRPSGIVLRPFEIFRDVSAEESNTTFKPLLQELRTSDSFLKFPLNKSVPHICSVTGSRSKVGEAEEAKIEPGKVTIVANRIIGRPFIVNSRDLFGRNRKLMPKVWAERLKSKQENDRLDKMKSGLQVASNLPEEAILKHDYSRVVVHYGAALDKYEPDIFDPIKTTLQFGAREAVDHVTRAAIEAPGFIHDQFVRDMPVDLQSDEVRMGNVPELDAFFFNVLVGSDHFPALLEGEHRFAAKRGLQKLGEWNSALLREIRRLVSLIQVRDTLESEIAKKDNAESSHRAMVSIRTQAMKSQELVEDFAKDVDPNLVSEISRITIPENVNAPDFEAELKKFYNNNRWPDYIPLYKAAWTLGLKTISLKDWNDTH